MGPFQYRPSPWWALSRLFSPLLQMLTAVWGYISVIKIAASTFLSATKSFWSGLIQLAGFALMAVGVWVNPATGAVAVATAGIVSGICSLQSLAAQVEPLCTWMNTLTGWDMNEKALVCEMPPRLSLREPVVADIAVTWAFRRALSLYPNSTGDGMITVADKEEFLVSVQEHEHTIKAHLNNINRTQDALGNLLCIMQKYPTSTPSNYSSLTQLRLSMHISANPHVLAVADLVKDLARHADEQLALRKALVHDLGHGTKDTSRRLATMINEACGLETRAVQWRNSVLKEIENTEDQIRKARSPAHESTARYQQQRPDNYKQIKDAAMKRGNSMRIIRRCGLLWG
ncbi:hypothetical protein B0T22DRAFT_438677 [Podospora appendiculata]|uniref:Uncharacterized protein n=1 Tax=Podospora appendiculata TaxID=314037 RepID=A0AAE1CIM9_9PEZI|nr:hypothetical protein B0T22DRAFT_438677 [Podospora appendiculata]